MEVFGEHNARKECKAFCIEWESGSLEPGQTLGEPGNNKCSLWKSLWKRDSISMVYPTGHVPLEVSRESWKKSFGVVDSQLIHKYKWSLYYRKRNKDIIFLPLSLWENHHRMLKVIQNILSSLFVFLSCPWGIWWPRSRRHPARISRDWSARSENLSEWLLLPFQSHRNDRLVELSLVELVTLWC